MTLHTAAQAKERHIAAMGEPLGRVYDELQQECWRLHSLWAEFTTMYGHSSERIDLLNAAAGHFFRVVQDTLWEATLMHIARMTDRPTPAGRDTLTLQRLPGLVRLEVRPAVRQAVDEAVRLTSFARDWRNRHIAHRDLQLAVNQEQAKPLEAASRRDVNEALAAIASTLNLVDEHYTRSTTMYDSLGNAGGAESLLYVVRDGLEAEAAKRHRFETGTFTEDDLKHPPLP